MALQDLQADSRPDVPKTGRLVRAGSQDPAALGAEADLPDVLGEMSGLRTLSPCQQRYSTEPNQLTLLKEDKCISGIIK